MPFGSAGTNTGVALEKKRGMKNAKKKVFAWTFCARWSQTSDPTKAEYFWMRTLKTHYPYGLIVEETFARFIVLSRH